MGGGTKEVTMMDNEKKCRDCVYFRCTGQNVGICQDREAYVGANTNACGWYLRKNLKGEASGTSFIARQPNGLLCRWSDIIDDITDYNMTDEEYIAACERKAREQAEEVLKHYVRPFAEVRFAMAECTRTEEYFNELLKKMSKKTYKMEGAK